MPVWIYDSISNSWESGANEIAIGDSAIPTISSITPNPGRGGESVDIVGSGFITNNGGFPFEFPMEFPEVTTVSFAGVAASSVNVTSGTTLSCIPPAHADGQVTVTVTTAGGTSAGYTWSYLETTTSGPYDITGATYYIKPGGNDSANGTSPATAWATLAHAMTHSYTAGDGLLLERGGVYNTPGITPPQPGVKGSERWIIGAYGTGTRPVLNVGLTLSSWSLYQTGIWQASIARPNIGSITTASDRVARGIKKFSLGACTTLWDFYDNGSTLYVRADSNPGTLIAAPMGHGVWCCSRLEIRDLEIAYCGGLGINGPATNIVVKGCYLHHIGGSEFTAGGRYGNGIEVWSTSANWLVDGNILEDIFDAATTAQGTSGVGAQNIVFSNNTITRATQAFEIFHAGTGLGPSVTFQGNTCNSMGYGFGQAGSPDRPANVNDGRRCAILTDYWDSGTASSCIVTGNVFNDCYYYNYNYGHGLIPGYNAHNNDIRMITGHRMNPDQSYTINNAAAWATANYTESGSTFTVL